MTPSLQKLGSQNNLGDKHFLQQSMDSTLNKKEKFITTENHLYTNKALMKNNNYILCASPKKYMPYSII